MCTPGHRLIAGLRGTQTQTLQDQKDAPQYWPGRLKRQLSFCVCIYRFLLFRLAFLEVRQARAAWPDSASVLANLATQIFEKACVHPFRISRVVLVAVYAEESPTISNQSDADVERWPKPPKRPRRRKLTE